MKLVVMATGNKGKVKEVRQIVGGAQVLTMKEVGLSMDIIEDGTSFRENALIKARSVFKAIQEGKANVKAEDVDLVISDDSGLEIDYFDKKPGIYSARWLGQDTPYTIKNQTVLDKMKDVPDDQRTARYVCAMAAILKDGEEFVTEETAEGFIAHEPAGQNGFGYDPIFYFPPLGTFAQISPEQKNAVSHRGKALRAMKELLDASGLTDTGAVAGKANEAL